MEDRRGAGQHELHRLQNKLESLERWQRSQAIKDTWNLECQAEFNEHVDKQMTSLLDQVIKLRRMVHSLQGTHIGASVAAAPTGTVQAATQALAAAAIAASQAGVQMEDPKYSAVILRTLEELGFPDHAVTAANAAMEVIAAAAAAAATRASSLPLEQAAASLPASEPSDEEVAEEDTSQSEPGSEHGFEGADGLVMSDTTPNKEAITIQPGKRLMEAAGPSSQKKKKKLSNTAELHFSYGDAGYLLDVKDQTRADEATMLNPEHNGPGKSKSKEDQWQAHLRVCRLFNSTVEQNNYKRSPVPIILPHKSSLACFQKNIRLSAKGKRRFQRSRELYEEAVWKTKAKFRMETVKRSAINSYINFLISGEEPLTGLPSSAAECSGKQTIEFETIAQAFLSWTTKKKDESKRGRL